MVAPFGVGYCVGVRAGIEFALRIVDRELFDLSIAEG